MVELYGIDLNLLSKVKTWKEFDDNFTVKVHGYDNVAEYYRDSSCQGLISNITVPTLVIHSKDDPVIPIDCLPLGECIANNNIVVGISKRGAHCCYFEGPRG